MTTKTLERLMQITRTFGGLVSDAQIVIRVRDFTGKEENDRFYCTIDAVEIKLPGVLLETYGDGATPEAAMDDYLNKITGKTLVYHATGDDRKELMVI